MRQKLASNNEQRLRFRASVARFGKKQNWNGYAEDTILLTDIRFAETNEYAADHIWFTMGKIWLDLRLNIGDCIEFDARIGQYKKGYVHRLMETKNKKIDYKLNRPTKITKVKT